MGRLADALRKRPDLKVVASKIVAEKYSEEIDRKTAATFDSVIDRVNTVINEMWDRCQQMIRIAVRDEMSKLEIPERIVREQPQVIERIVVKEVENALRKQEQEEEAQEEREEPKVMMIKRDETGLITSVVKGDTTYTMVRNRNGRVTKVKIG